MCEVIVSQANDGMGTSVSIMCLPISLLSIQIDLFHLACPVKRQLCRSELSLHIYACTLELCNCSEQQQHPEMEYCIRSGFSGFFFISGKEMFSFSVSGSCQGVIQFVQLQPKPIYRYHYYSPIAITKCVCSGNMRLSTCCKNKCRLPQRSINHRNFLYAAAYYCIIYSSESSGGAAFISLSLCYQLLSWFPAILSMNIVVILNCLDCRTIINKQNK